MEGNSGNGNRKLKARLRSTAKIEEVATKLFVTRGYTNTRIDDIARKARLTKGGVYHYYGSKESIFLGILDRLEAEIIDESIRRTGEMDGTNAEKIVQMIHYQGQYSAEHPDNFMYIVRASLEFAGTTNRIGRKINNMYRKMIECFALLIADGRRCGEFSPLIGDYELAHFIVGAYDGNVLEWYRSGREASVGRSLVKALRVTVLHTLRFDRRSGVVARKSLPLA